MATPCPVPQNFSGNNPTTPEQRAAIWKWAKDNVSFLDYETVHKAINNKFFGGRAKPEWITDILAGKKTAFKPQTTTKWRAQYDRQRVVKQALDLQRYAGTSAYSRVGRTIWNSARILETIGHGIVFPFSHGGDLLFRPASWGTFFKGVKDTYASTFSKAHDIAAEGMVKSDPLYNYAIQSGVEMGDLSHARGILETPGSVLKIINKLQEPAGRAWRALGRMRFELWKKAMKRHLSEGMTQDQILDYGREFATWANDATGAGKGRIANLGSDVLFGPRLTQSKINRLAELAKTPADFANWKNLSAGERAVAFQRFRGAAQYAITKLGFLAVNAGLLQWLGSKQKINYTDPSKSDYMQFKGAGLEAMVPGLGSEIRALSRILAISYAAYHGKNQRTALQNKFLRDKPLDVAKDYAESKLNPIFSRISEVVRGHDWLGRPLPFSPEKGTAEKPKMTWPEYAASIGPIPLQGPIKYFYDHMRASGASSLDAVNVTKGLIAAGIGAGGIHIKEETPEKSKSVARPKSLQQLQNKQPRQLKELKPL